jgi:hypothetical protein
MGASLYLAASFRVCYCLGKEQGMIEFTQEQWEAITQEENPTVIDPDAKQRS